MTHSPNIRRDDNEPLYQHQVERDELLPAATKRQIDDAMRRAEREDEAEDRAEQARARRRGW